ncbi:metal ABC transporter substrate-binding protein [Pseudactinotalea sp. HY158]|uniref:metal ABC transporter substrate-binding protein n=1 Tax=Pseudactinotalea sp. HY158 TaxID=2654547 RepID=UPI00129C66B7|nr:metal ABC transporter substrate-binding protein [Pseudactinotalea sp. HY158]QGH68633.1 metal ABC transporter substrate-binding protein [Pseudactinotalea sp. HY158]
MPSPIVVCRPGPARRRRGAAIAASLAVLTLAAACSGGPGSTGIAGVDAGPGAGPGEDKVGASGADDRPLVLTTFTVLADIARNVAGDHLQVESLTKVGAEIHGYQPTPSDLQRAEGADLVLDNGLGLEAWFARFIGSGSTAHVTVTDGVDVLPIAGGPESGAPNPHAWMSPVNAGVYVDNIAAAFAELDPAHAADYRAAGARYRREVEAVGTGLLDRLAGLPSSARMLVTCEGAFSYLARDADLTEGYLWAVNAEQEATPRTVAGVIDVVRERGVPAVFCESTISPRTMMRVVESTGAAFGGTLYVDSLSPPDGPVPTYLDLLRHDADVIAGALTAGHDDKEGR